MMSAKSLVVPIFVVVAAYMLVGGLPAYGGAMSPGAIDPRGPAATKIGLLRGISELQDVESSFGAEDGLGGGYAAARGDSAAVREIIKGNAGMHAFSFATMEFGDEYHAQVFRILGPIANKTSLSGLSDSTCFQTESFQSMGNVATGYYMPHLSNPKTETRPSAAATTESARARRAVVPIGEGGLPTSGTIAMTPLLLGLPAALGLLVLAVSLLRWAWRWRRVKQNISAIDGRQYGTLQQDNAAQSMLLASLGRRESLRVRTTASPGLTAPTVQKQEEDVRKAA